MNFCTNEVNYLVYRYLLEGGFQHSAFTFFVESQLGMAKIATNLVPRGALLEILQNHVGAHLAQFSPPPKPRPGTISKQMNIALERRRASFDFKKKQFARREELRRKWKKGLSERRMKRNMADQDLEFKRTLRQSFLFKKAGTGTVRRKRMSTPECPLDSCPKKTKYRRRVSFYMNDKIGRIGSTESLSTHISKSSLRSRTPIRWSDFYQEA